MFLCAYTLFTTNVGAVSFFLILGENLKPEFLQQNVNTPGGYKDVKR